MKRKILAIIPFTIVIILTLLLNVFDIGGIQKISPLESIGPKNIPPIISNEILPTGDPKIMEPKEKIQIFFAGGNEYINNGDAIYYGDNYFINAPDVFTKDVDNNLLPFIFDGKTTIEIIYNGINYKNENYGPTSVKPIDVGNYIVKFKINEDNDLYFGSEDYTFSILPKELDIEYICNIEDIEYTGSEIEPDIYLKDGTLLKKDVDYIPYYENNINIGEGSVKAEFIGNYKGEIETKFLVIGKKLSLNNISLDNLNFVFDNLEKRPNAIIKDDDYILIENEDYIISYEDNINVGLGKVHINFYGNYSGKLTKLFNINPFSNITEENISPIEDQIYDKNGIFPDIQVVIDKHVLKKDIDYNIFYYDNDKIGKGKVSISFINNYSGNIVKEFNILPSDNYNDINIEVEDKLMYTSFDLYPNVIIKEKDNILEENKDYILTYENNIDKGLGKVNITFIKDYYGTTEKEFEIIPNTNIKIENISDIPDQMYIGKEICPKPSIVYNNIILKENTDYIIEYKDNKNVGIGTLLISLINNYEGSFEKTFNITENNLLNNDNISFIEDKMFTGYPICPIPKISYYDLELVEGIDYYINYENNINVGSALIKITFKGNFKGEIVKTFNIIKNDKITINNVNGPENVYYNGEPLMPNLAITNGDILLKSGTDYDLYYKDNINVGKASVFIKLKGNYVGEIIKEYLILPLDISDLCEYNEIENTIYDSTPKYPSVIIKYLGNQLENGLDYDISYENNLNAGLASIKVKFKGNYNGEKIIDFIIERAKVNIKTDNIMWNGEELNNINYTYKITSGTIYGTDENDIIIFREEGNGPGRYKIFAIMENENYDLRVTSGELTIPSYELSASNILIINSKNGLDPNISLKANIIYSSSNELFSLYKSFLNEYDDTAAVVTAFLSKYDNKIESSDIYDIKIKIPDKIKGKEFRILKIIGDKCDIMKCNDYNEDISGDSYIISDGYIKTKSNIPSSYVFIYEKDCVIHVYGLLLSIFILMIDAVLFLFLKNKSIAIILIILIHSALIYYLYNVGRCSSCNMIMYINMVIALLSVISSFLINKININKINFNKIFLKSRK